MRNSRESIFVVIRREVNTVKSYSVYLIIICIFRIYLQQQRETMIQLILIIFILFWLMGYIHIGFFNYALFNIASHPFTVQSLLLFLLILFLISLLPGIFRTIAVILLILWLFSTFGLFFIGGLSNIFFLIIVLAVLFSFIQNSTYENKITPRETNS